MQIQQLAVTASEETTAPRMTIPRAPLLARPAVDAANEDGQPNEDGQQLARGARELYESLLHANDRPDTGLRMQARAFVERWREEMRGQPCDLPASPEGLATWQQANLASTGAAYQAYLAERKAGSPRRYFSTRSHALNFLRAVAPTKLVDGAWLYGLLPDAANPHLNDLILTYVEELGDGDPDKNHVLLYRRLLDSMGIVDWAEQPDDAYVQGALQLSLAACTTDLLPEVIGFNLGYEQLPLHLLITAYELDELGIDPTYFTLHVTVDNAAGGHAQRALRAAAENLPALADREAFWARVADGYMLSNAGQGTTDAIAAFDGHEALLQVLGGRATEGSLAHSDYCRIEGRTVNQWLADPEAIGGFVAALERKGWLVRGSDPAQSRFWALLQGDRASMFGVFGDYELQVIYDWIRGTAAKDGAPFVRSGPGARPPAPPRAFRHGRRARLGEEPLSLDMLAEDGNTLDPDLSELRQVMAGSGGSDRGAVLRRLLGPALHWGPAGLEATRHVAKALRAA